MWDFSSHNEVSNLHPLHWKYGVLTIRLPGSPMFCSVFLMMTTFYCSWFSNTVSSVFMSLMILHVSMMNDQSILNSLCMRFTSSYPAFLGNNNWVLNSGISWTHLYPYLTLDSPFTPIPPSDNLVASRHVWSCGYSALVWGIGWQKCWIFSPCIS